MSEDIKGEDVKQVEISTRVNDEGATEGTRILVDGADVTHRVDRLLVDIRYEEADVAAARAVMHFSMQVQEGKWEDKDLRALCDAMHDDVLLKTINLLMDVHQGRNAE